MDYGGDGSRPRDSRYKIPQTRAFAILLLTVFAVVMVVWFDRTPHFHLGIIGGSNSIPSYESRQSRWHVNHWKACFGMSAQPDFFQMDELLAKWSHSKDVECRLLMEQFSDMYRFEQRVGTVDVMPDFRRKIAGWLQNDAKLMAELKHQVVFSLFNLHTHESSLFSRLRSKRPGLRGDGDPWAFAKKLAEESKASCDFCHYRTMTASDSFGRMESTHAVAVSNVFKYEAYHGLILLKRHDPLAFTEVEFMDMMSLLLRWFSKAHSARPEFRFPNFNWDMLPRASASQIHPHGQAALAPHHNYGLMEHIRLAAVEYAARHDNRLNYFTTLRELHNVFGLTVTVGGATAMGYLTPKKDFEVFIMAPTPSNDFFLLVFHTLRTFLDDMQIVSYSMGMYLPPVDHWNVTGASEDIPAVARVISRGSVSSQRSDISAMELFGASQVNQDPFVVIGKLRRRVERAGLTPA